MALPVKQTKEVKNHWQLPGTISFSIGTLELPPRLIRHAENNSVMLEVQSSIQARRKSVEMKWNRLFILQNIELHHP